MLCNLDQFLSPLLTFGHHSFLIPEKTEYTENPENSKYPGNPEKYPGNLENLENSGFSGIFWIFWISHSMSGVGRQ